MNFVGHSDNNCLFGLDSYGVVIDKSTKEVVSVEYSTYICPNCASAHTFLKQDDACPKCHTGVVEQDLAMKAQF